MDFFPASHQSDLSVPLNSCYRSSQCFEASVFGIFLPNERLLLCKEDGMKILGDYLYLSQRGGSFLFLFYIVRGMLLKIVPHLVHTHAKSRVQEASN